MDKLNLSLFDEYARTNAWGDPESLSGPGSTLQATANLRPKLEETFTKLAIRSLVDAPCGDMNWMRHLNYSFEKFIGVDLVSSLIDNLKHAGLPLSHHFQVGNIVTDILPRADAVFCRDCLVHLPFAAIAEALRLWKLAGFQYVFTTTFPKWGANTDCVVGDWRPLNLQLSPFDWPAPAFMLEEDCGLPPPYDSKSIGVWVLDGQ